MAMKGVHQAQKNLTKNASQPKRGGDYDKSAHGSSYHEQHGDGQAFGKVNATAPMDYVRKTNAEGAKSQPVGGIDAPRSMMGQASACVGSQVPAHNAHSIGGHTAHKRSGPLRMSGVAGAHRVGKR